MFSNLFNAYKQFYDASVKRDASGEIIDVAFSIVDMRPLVFASTTSMLINPASVGKLASLYEAELRQGARVPIDLFIRKMCHDGALRVVCIFPFITSIRPESSFVTTMARRFDALPAMAGNMLRHTFYIGSDWSQCADQANRLFPQPDPSDLHRQLMLRLLGYSLLEGAAENR